MKNIIAKLYEKYELLSITLKASIWFTFGNLVLKGIGFITAPIFSRLLPSSEYGALTVFMSYEQIILTLATWEIALSAYQKGIYKYKDNIKYFTSSTQLLSNIITFVFFSIIFALFPIASKFTDFELIDVVLLLIYMLFQPAYSCWLVVRRTEFKYRQAVYATLTYSVLNVIVPLVSILFFGKTAQVKFRSGLIISICIYFIFYLKNMKYISLFKNRKLLFQQWKFIILYQAPIVIHALSYTALAQSDRIMISKMVGESEAGFYSIAYSIANIATLFSNSFNQALVPWRFDRLEKKEYDDIKNNTPYLLVIIAAIIIMFIFISPEVMRLLFTDEYYEAVWCIPPVALSVYFIFLYTMFVWVENYYEKTGYVAIVSIICAIVNIMLNYLLIGVFGYVVCGYTTVASYVLFSVGHYVFMRKACKDSEVTETIYDPKSTLLISIVTIILSVGITILYPYPIARYAILSIAAIICIIKKDIIIDYICKFKKRDLTKQ